MVKHKRKFREEAFVNRLNRLTIYYSHAEVARRTGYHDETVRRYRTLGKFPARFAAILAEEFGISLDTLLLGNSERAVKRRILREAPIEELIGEVLRRLEPSTLRWLLEREEAIEAGHDDADTADPPELGPVLGYIGSVARAQPSADRLKKKGRRRKKQARSA